MSTRYLDVLKKVPYQDRMHLRILIRTKFDVLKAEIKQGPKKIEYATWSITLSDFSDLEDLLRVLL